MLWAWHQLCSRRRKIGLSVSYSPDKFIAQWWQFSLCYVLIFLLDGAAKHYLRYFFTRVQAEETRLVIRERLPVFQAIYFSSALLILGSAGSYLIYSYFGIDREIRNVLVKITLAVGSSWFVFFVCRSFERFFRDWVWLVMSVGLAQVMDGHLNPMCKDEMVVSFEPLNMCLCLG